VGGTDRRQKAGAIRAEPRRVDAATIDSDD
jgi:hypothetical protein